MTVNTDDASGGSGRLARAPSGVPTPVSSAWLYASHHRKIRGHILSMVHDPIEADDLTQEVFLRAHRKLHTVRDPDALTSWLYRIATHVCYDRYRKTSRQPRLDPLDVTGSDGPGLEFERPDEVSLVQVIERAEMSSCVRKYLDGLPDGYRQVILLHDLEESTNPEIAEMLGVSLDAVKIRLHRARRRLQATLNEHCDFSYDEHGVFVCEPAPAPSVPVPLSRSKPTD
ncbi:MAG TPA: RNA polymerase sigma factor [Acidimicrobiia bacterium]|nr:RNA polymerase sigma factor [Acidimicrobiia bacterium]